MVMNKTQQFAQEVKVTTDDTWYLKPDQTYVNAHTKIVLVHRHCNTEKAVTPRDFRNRGIYCRTCKTHTELKPNPYKVSRHITPQQFAKRFYSILGHDYELLSDYVNTKTKVKVRHKPCGTVYTVYPTNVTQNHSGCPHCSAVQARYKQLANKVPFSQRVQQAVGDEYTFLQPYTSATTKMAVYHQDCGHIYYTTPNKFLNSNNRCPYCAKNRQLTTDRFKRELHGLVGNEYILLTPYVNAKTKVKVRHNKCGHTYWVVPSSFTSGGRRCPYCYGNIKKGTDEFRQEVFNLVGNDYEVLGTYQNADTPIKMKHNRCNHTYMVTPHNFLRGNRCPYCSQSHGEDIIYHYLDAKGLKEHQDFYYGYVLSNKLHLDFYLPQYKLAFEYDGIQHYQAIEYFGGKERFKKQQARDQLKNQYCKDNAIKLVRIPYTYNTKEQIEKILNQYFN